MKAESRQGWQRHPFAAFFKQEKIQRTARPWRHNQRINLTLPINIPFVKTDCFLIKFDCF
jgi:hypothetical protein